MTGRFVILHSHLFKNAGTSVDRILQQNFPGRWHSTEFAPEKGGNTQSVARWIEETPTGVAYSSHTMLGPLPHLPGVRVIPLMMLRDPVERIASAYRFERAQDALTQGATLAKQHGFAGYVHARLSRKGDRQCRNFQTSRLAAMCPDPGGSEHDRARAVLQLLVREGVLGLVSDFDAAMRRLAQIIQPLYPAFSWQPVIENVSGGAASQMITPEMEALLNENNRDDLALIDEARVLLDQLDMAGRPQAAGMM